MASDIERLEALQSMMSETTETLTQILAGITKDMRVKAGPAPDPPLDIINELQWNDGSPWQFPTRNKPDLPTRVKYITIHHSAGQRASTNIMYWNRLHTVSKNWPHIGYHFAIAALDRGGSIGLYQCNRIGETTWHDARNRDTVGVCIAGDLRAGHDDAPTPEQVQLTGQLLAWLVPQLPNFVGVTFHKLIQATACPGDVERWGGGIVEAAQKYGLDLTGRFGVKPAAVMRTRIMNIFRNEPPVEDYDNV